MTRRRRPATYITNVHPDGRVCRICRGPIVTGEGAYVTTDGRFANHSTPCPVR